VTGINSTYQPPDLDDVKESVKQGVTKVAGKLSSLANGMMSSFQVLTILLVNKSKVFINKIKIIFFVGKIWWLLVFWIQRLRFNNF